MHRAILQACLPWFFWLCVASGLVLLLVQLCGSRIDWRRLRHLPRGEEGSVQSLSLVLTLPVFLMLVLFIVQVTQVMVGIMMVNYAAFAAARAASVWIPADVTTDSSFRDPPFNDPMIDLIDPSSASAVNDRIMPDGTINNSSLQGDLEQANVVAGPGQFGNPETGGESLMESFEAYKNLKYQRIQSYKYQKIIMAGVIPCLTISPSRDFNTNVELPSQFQNTYLALSRLYPQVDPKSRSNNRMSQRLFNKLRYAARYTTVELRWQNVPHPTPDTWDGPTYNPYDHPAITSGVPPWNRNEVGFRDPITVTVSHEFALLPGIGRILNIGIDSEDATKREKKTGDDRTAARVNDPKDDNESNTVTLQASATFVNEGFKSLVRYAVQP